MAEQLLDQIRDVFEGQIVGRVALVLSVQALFLTFLEGL